MEGSLDGPFLSALNSLKIRGRITRNPMKDHDFDNLRYDSPINKHSFT